MNNRDEANLKTEQLGKFVQIMTGQPPIFEMKVSGSITTTTTKKKEENGEQVTVEKWEIDNLRCGVYAAPATIKAFQMFQSDTSGQKVQEKELGRKNRHAPPPNNGDRARR
jgi:hypothetical protein